jgi:hypothetical protein
MARSGTASEFGKRWDRRIPRGDIKWLVSRYHVTASSAEDRNGHQAPMHGA